MATLPTSMLIGISSPHKRNGLLYAKWCESYGKDDDDVLVVAGASGRSTLHYRRRSLTTRWRRTPQKRALNGWANGAMIWRSIFHAR